MILHDWCLIVDEVAYHLHIIHDSSHGIIQG
jgi:hypothetical protein